MGIAKRLAPSLVACFGMLWAPSASAQEDALKRRFLAEYEPAFRKLEDFYGKIQIRAKVSERNFPWRKGDRAEDLFFKANGPLFRLEQVRRDDDEQIAGSTVARVVNARRPFVLRKLPHQHAFRIEKVGGAPQKQREHIRIRAKLPFAPYCFLEKTIPELINDPTLDFKIKELVKLSRQEKPLVKMIYERQVPPEPGHDQPIKLVGSFLFAPEECWAIQEYAFGPPSSPNTMRCAIEYEKADQGFPLVKRAEYWREGENGVRSEVVTIEAIETILAPVPENEFEMSAFGIPDATEAGISRSALLLFIAAQAFLAALFFRYMAKRRQAA